MRCIYRFKRGGHGHKQEERCTKAATVGAYCKGCLKSKRAYERYHGLRGENEHGINEVSAEQSVEEVSDSDADSIEEVIPRKGRVGRQPLVSQEQKQFKNASVTISSNPATATFDDATAITKSVTMALSEFFKKRARPADADAGDANVDIVNTEDVPEVISPPKRAKLIDLPEDQLATTPIVPKQIIAKEPVIEKQQITETPVQKSSAP